MAICKKCGAELEENNKFCLKCGEPVEVLSDSQSEILADITAETPEAAGTQEASLPIGTDFAESVTQQGAEQPEAELQGMETQQAKKLPKNAKKAGIIAAAVVAFLLICGFTAKTYFVRDLKILFMGQNKYMQTVESGTANLITDQTVQALDSAMQQTSLKGNNTASDLQMTVHTDLDNSFSSQFNKQNGGEEALKKFIDYYNTITIKGSGNVNNQQMQANLSFADKTNTLFTLNMFMDKDGKYIYQLPELSKIYFIMDSTAGKANPVIAAEKFKYDSVKLKASLRALAQVYVDAVPSGKMSVEKNQSITVDGVAVSNAQKISVTFNEKQVTDILTKMAETAKKDDYLYTLVSENSTEKMDKAEYEKEVDSFIAQLSGASLPKELTVSAYVMADDTQVARSYEITQAGAAGKSALNLVFTKKENQNQIAADIMKDGKEYGTAKILFSSSTSGTMQFSVKDPEQKSDVGLKIDFSDLKKVKVMNRDTMLGKFTVSISDPNGTINNMITANLGAESTWAKDLSKSTMTIVNTMENDKLNSNIAMDLKGLAKIQVNCVSTAKTSGAITMPSIKEGDAIELSPTKDEEAQAKLQKQYTKDTLTYLSALLDKDKNLADLMQTVGVSKEMISYYQQQME